VPRSWPSVTATLSTLLAEMFQPEVRYSGISVGYQIGGALVGGTAPLVGTLLLAADHGRWRWIACYIAGISLVSFIAASRSQDGQADSDLEHATNGGRIATTHLRAHHEQRE
jgi:MFS family permease